MYGRHYKIIGKCIRGNIITKVILGSQDDDLRRPEEECEQSDEEDWRITVEDEEQCDDNEVSLSDDDGEPQSKRQRISL